MSKLTDFIKSAKPVWVLFLPSIKTIAFIYVMAITLGLQHNVNTFCAAQIGSVLKTVYDTLSQNSLVNWLTSLLLVITGGYFAYRISKGKVYSWIVLFCLFLIISLLCDDDWLWAKSALLVDYRWLFVIILGTFVVCGLIPFINKIKKIPRYSVSQPTVSGFSMSGVICCWHRCR